MKLSNMPYSNFGEFERKRTPVIESRKNLIIESARRVDSKNTQNINIPVHSKNVNSNFNTNKYPQAIQQSNQKSPKEEYHFAEKPLKRCNSTGRVLIQNYKEQATKCKNNPNPEENKDNSYVTNNSRVSNVSSAGMYLNRRHRETQEKINKMRMQKFTEETTQMKFKPNISENSKKIIEKLVVKETNNSRIYPNGQEDSNYNRNVNNSNSKEINSMTHSKSHKNLLTKNSSTKQLTTKLNKTIEEMQDYKKIIEKREVREEEVSVFILIV